MTSATVGTRAATAPRRRPGRDPRPGDRLRRRNALIGWTFILPNFLGFAILTLIPVLALFWMSLTKWEALAPATSPFPFNLGFKEFIGFDNFVRLFGDPTFRTSVLNTVYYAALYIPVTLGLALGLALLLNSRLKGIAFFRTAAFFPYITSVVAIAIVWGLILQPDTGILNQLLGAILGPLGVPADALPGWYFSSMTWAIPGVVLVSAWRDMGYYMILLLAGLQTIPTELYEAAQMDGAGAIRRFWNITLPGLRPTMFFVTIMMTINALKIFDLVLVLTDGGPGTATFMLSHFIWRQGIEQGHRGYASSGAIVLFAICITVTIVQFLVNKRRER